jgi:hypothetical protein
MWAMMGMLALGAAIFWVILLIDCIRNRFLSGRSKVLWILALLFGNWVGMLLYFFLACSFSPTAQMRRSAQPYAGALWQTPAPPYQPYRPYEPYRPSYPPVPASQVSPVPDQYDQPYRPYEQGYQAQTKERPKTVQFMKDLPIEEGTSYQSQYEQPQVSYPEMPPQEQ